MEYNEPQITSRRDTVRTVPTCTQPLIADILAVIRVAHHSTTNTGTNVSRQSKYKTNQAVEVITSLRTERSFLVRVCVPRMRMC